MNESIDILLVIDDDPGMRSQLRWGLDDYDVIIAENRSTALQQLAAHCPPVVTLDLGLPPDAEGTREGFQTLTDILSQAPDTRVVVVSGAMDADNAARAMQYGAFSYFTKPVNIHKLRHIIENAYKDYRLDTDQP